MHDTLRTDVGSTKTINTCLYFVANFVVLKVDASRMPPTMVDHDGWRGFRGFRGFREFRGFHALKLGSLSSSTYFPDGYVKCENCWPTIDPFDVKSKVCENHLKHP